MERNLLIELLEDGDKVSLYSPHFEGEEYSEFEKFLLAYKDTYPDDVRQLVYILMMYASSFTGLTSSSVTEQPTGTSVMRERRETG